MFLAISANAQTALKKVYNEEINPLEQIDQAVAKAKAEGKFVVCQVGGNWCIWCLRFADFITNDTAISKVINDNFEYIHVNYNPRKSEGEEKARQGAALMNRLDNCGRFGFPVFVILDETGKVLHIQDSSFLEEGQGYNQEKVLRFFKNWTPKAVNNGAKAKIIDLPRTGTPDKVAKAMENFFQGAASEKKDIHSVMIVKNGNVIYSRWQSKGAENTPHVLHSVSKTFTATAVGMAIAEGKMALTDRVIDYFPDKLPANISENLKAMTVRDLLTMSCGHDTEPSVRNGQQDWVTAFLAHPVEHKPGTFYLYNSMGTYVLSAIVQKVTGERLVDYLNTRLFIPLHINKPTWETSPQGINCGGWGLYLKTEDLAKMGQLLLQKGQWNGQQLIPAEWVAEMSKKQVESINPGTRIEQAAERGMTKETSDWMQGYGYQMWRCRPGCFRADGARGQYIIVVPDKDAVIAITADVEDLQGELNLVWKHILPAL